MAPISISLIWTYFLKEKPNIAKCTLCSKKLMTKNGNTKGLWTHIKSMHPCDSIELNKLVNQEKINKSNESEMNRKVLHIIRYKKCIV